ncbi:MAG: hypothetical protein J7K83_02565, partial [Candidatus Aenigmarchaeota archaeon]|nr:hypothetical protein [Candidatus Aenigmarchaeota archaeon]
VFEGTEMWVNFSSNPVVLEPYKEKEVEVTISTKPNIYPGEYLVKIYANVSVEQVVETEVRHGFIVEYVNVTSSVAAPQNVTVIETYENTTRINELQNRINELESELSHYKEIVEEMEKINESESEITGRASLIGQITGAIVALPYKSIIAGLVGIVIVIALYLKFKKH